MTLINMWLRAIQSTRGLRYSPSSTCSSLWSIVKAASESTRMYIGAAPTLMHLATPAIWPVCYYPDWIIENSYGLLSNAPDKLSWLLTKWSFDFLPIRPMSEVPTSQPCAFVYSDLYNNQCSSGKLIETWPSWPDTGTMEPMAIFRPVFNQELALPTDTMIRLFDSAMREMATAREEIDPVEAAGRLAEQDNPFIWEDEEVDEEEEEYYEDGEEPDYEENWP